MSEAEAQTPKLLVPAREAAAMLSMGRSTFWQHVKYGRLPSPLKIGGATRWRVADLQSFVNSGSQDGLAPTSSR